LNSGYLSYHESSVKKLTQNQVRGKPSESASRAMAMLFTPEYRRRTFLNAVYLFV
jgi:hypothetical protein